MPLTAAVTIAAQAAKADQGARPNLNRDHFHQLTQLCVGYNPHNERVNMNKSDQELPNYQSSP